MAFDSKPGARIHRYSETLSLIELLPPLSGFSQFIGVWLYRGAYTCLVDVGPAVTVGPLLKALRDMQITHLDYVLLTHIHLDHAGGVGELALRFARTPIVCHGKGLAHLADPSRLWEGSIKTLGKTARAYGSMRPVPDRLLVDAASVASDALRPVLTPGHSPHHVSYLTPDYLFAGEAGGVYLALPDGGVYLRPATPPRFFLDTALSSIDTLTPRAPGTICYGHFGLHRDAEGMLGRHRAQLLRWRALIDREMRHPVAEGLDESRLVEKCLERLLAEDPELSGYPYLSEAEKHRERGFLRNSIKGFVQGGHG